MWGRRRRREVRGGIWRFALGVGDRLTEMSGGLNIGVRC